jgi:hypothetical protein
MVKFLVFAIILNLMVEANRVNFYLNRAPTYERKIPSIEQQIIAKMIERNGIGSMDMQDLIKYHNILKNIRRSTTKIASARMNRLKHFTRRHLSID